VWSTQPTSAGELRAWHVARALQQIASLKIVVLEDDDAIEDAADDVTSNVALRVGVRLCPNIGWAQKVNWLLNPRSPTPHGIGVNQADLQRVRDMAGQFDAVWFFELRTANMFRWWKWPRSVVDINDVPSMFVQSVVAAERVRHKRVSGRLRQWSWQRRERLLKERFGVLTVCSEGDQRYLQQLGVTGPLHVVPNGYELPKIVVSRQPSAPPRLGFMGVFDHLPNVEGIHWFVRDCWPAIKRAIPDARLRLVGRFSDGPLTPDGVDIDALGYLDDPTQEMSTWSAMVVPVQTGAGTRGKIAHAFSVKCPVVSTSLGAYGYDARNAREIFLADAAAPFAAACVRTITEPHEASAVAERAWQQFLEKWTWDAIRPRIWAAADACLTAAEGVRANDHQ